MNEFFGPGGVLEQKLGDYEFRPSQIRMAEAVYQALDSGLLEYTYRAHNAQAPCHSQVTGFAIID